MNKASEDKLEFYTADPLSGQETAIRRGLTLPQAIFTFSRGEAAAIGATLDGRDVEIVQRWGDKPLLITDYQQDPHWRYNAELCVSAVNMAITHAGHPPSERRRGNPAPWPAHPYPSTAQRGRNAAFALADAART